MKTACITALAVTIMFGGIAIAADAPVQARPAANFEQRKADHLKRVDERIAHLQEERACIQAAANHDALKACHDKFRSEIRQDRMNRGK